MSNEDGFLCEMFSFENCCIKESYFVISYFGRGRGLFGMGFVSFFNKKLGFLLLQSQRKETSSMKHFHWYFYVGLGLFQSLPCRYLQRTLLFLCPMQLHGFEDNCFHWTQIRFLSLRMRPSISWVGPILSPPLPISACAYFLSLNLQQLFFYLLRLFLFAATTFYLQQLYLFCSNFFICSMFGVGHIPY